MKRILQFVLVTFLFSWSAWGLQIFGQEGVLPEWFQLFGMFGVFGPFVGFLVLIKLENKSYKQVFGKLFQKAPTWTIIFMVVSPFVLSGVSYLVYLGFVEGTPQPIGVTLITFIPIALMILFVGGPVEEFGWRGFLLPRLRQNYPFILTVIILGLIHGVWHLPLHFLNGTVQESLPILEYIAITVAITVSYVFVFEFTQSLIPFILLHWAANYSSAVFPYYYNVEGRYALLIVTVILDVVLIVIYYRRRQLSST